MYQQCNNLADFYCGIVIFHIFITLGRTGRARLVAGSCQVKSWPLRLLCPGIFFAVRGTAGEKDDPHGTILPNDAAALSYAERTIAELPKEESYDDPGMIMIVRNHTHQMVWSIPFLPAYA